MREHRQDRATKGVEVRNDQEAHSRPPAGESEPSAASPRSGGGFAASVRPARTLSVRVAHANRRSRGEAL